MDDVFRSECVRAQFPLPHSCGIWSECVRAQFPLPHSRGSSHGHSRITRKAYPEPFYAQMMIEAYRIWAELERNSGEKLYT